MRKYSPSNSKVSVDESGRVTFQDQPLWSDEDEKRMEVIGQNGNDGEHYETLEEATDLYDKDGIQITRYALGSGKGMGIQVSMTKRIALQSFSSSSGGGGYFNIHSQDLPKLLKAIQQASRAK